MNRAWILGAGVAVLVAGVYALSAQPVTTPAIVGIAGAYNSGAVTCTNLQPCWLQTDVNGQLKVTASVSSTVTGFPGTQTTGTPISVTAGGVTGTLPTGTEVVASNVGTTNAAYCKLGASATTSDQYIAPNGGWFGFTVGAATQLTCITSTSTTTVNMVGGSGLPTGTGGGSGSGSSSSITSWGGGTLGAMANYGTSPGAVLVPGINAFVTNATAPGQATPANSLPTVQAGMQYETVAASQTAQVLGGSGATGDYLSHCVIYPTSTSPGVVTVFDNASAAGTNAIAFPGGASSISNLVPFAIPVGAFSGAGPWKVTTGANLVVTCYGRFSA